MITSINANSGETVRFDQNNTAIGDVAKAAVSSASIPGIFPPFIWPEYGVMIDGSSGGMNVNLEDAITRCAEKVGGDESKIIIDALLCGGEAITPQEEKSGNTYSNYMRGRQISSAVNSSNSIEWAKREHPHVTFRYIVPQKDGATGLTEIEFDGDKTWKM